MEHINAQAARAGVAGAEGLLAHLPRHHTRRNGTAIANLHSKGTLPDDGRRFSGQTFWRSTALKRDLDAWLAREARGPGKLRKGQEFALDNIRIIEAEKKRARKAVRLKLIRAAGGIA